VRAKSESLSTPKFILVTGGVMSGLGKGVLTSSTAKLLQLSGLKASCVKIDPYVNFDAGTMNPIAHGEVFVTDDGGECDMDIGNYERFLDISMNESHNITTGRIYSEVIKAEREGKYLGQCVQIIPHVTDAIKDRLRAVASGLDVLVVECGGTVGDIESLPFLEALRQMQLESGESDSLFIHVTLAPILDVVGEQKTKPTQHSVQELRRIGIQPNILAIRCKNPLNHEAIHKISLFASVRKECVISCHDAPSIYHVPEILEQQGIIKVISLGLDLSNLKVRWDNWKTVTRSFLDQKEKVNIAVVGKYVDLPDSYVSVHQALLHASARLGKGLSIQWIDSELFESKNDNLKLLKNFDGILVPGGFGIRGSEGIMEATNFVREMNIPFLGICFGFQLAILEFAKHQCLLDDATSEEFNSRQRNQVIKFMPEQKNVTKIGGSMRLGKHEINLIPDTHASNIYGRYIIERRHRHRYEFNQEYRKLVEENGMVMSGSSDHGRRIEIVEIPKHKFFLAVQFHSEFTSRPGKPEESFYSFVRACVKS